MFCSKCGKQLADNSAFCTFCGSPTALSSASMPSVSAAAAPVSEPVQSVQSVQPVSAAIPTVSEPLLFATHVSAAAPPVLEPIQPDQSGKPVSGFSKTMPMPPVNSDTSLNAGAISEEVPSREPVEERVSVQAAPVFPGERAAELPREPLAGFPTPVDPPKTGVSVSVPTAPTTSTAPAASRDMGADLAAAVPEQVKEQKYYTFGHIALCLAAVAVMAIVAGVFAGLYFSTY